MDEVGLRVLLERAVEEEPPMGQLVSHSLLAGRRLAKRRRVKATIAAAVAVALVSVAVPAAFAALRPGAGQPPAAPARDRPTAYVWTEANWVTPIRLSTGTKYKRMIFPGRIMSMPAAPGGTAVYVFSYAGPFNMYGYGTAASSYMTRINGATGVAGRPVKLTQGVVDWALIAPGGRTAYALSYRLGSSGAAWAVIAINLATGAEHKLLAVNPDIAPLDLGGAFGLVLHDHILYTTSGGRMAAVDVATGRALPLIKVQHGSVDDIAIAPDGTNAYVTSSSLAKPYPTWVTPVSLATGRAGTPILAQARGFTPLWDTQIAVTPDGRTAYVYGGPTVIPVNLVSGRALKPITVPMGYGLVSLAISPTGSTAYANSLSKGLRPISVASSAPGRDVLLPVGYTATGPAAFSPGGDVLYVPAAKPGRTRYDVIIPIDTSTQQAGRAIRVSGIPRLIVVMP